MKIDVTKSYYVGFVYNNGEYSITNASTGETTNGITNKYKLQCLFPVEGSRLTKSLGGLSCATVDVDVDKYDIENVIQGGVKALSENYGSEIECSFDRKGRLLYLKWVK